MFTAPAPLLKALAVALTLTCVAAGSGVAQEGHLPVGPTATPGQGDATVTPLDIDGMAVTLSPDGQWIAGIGADNQFCIWEVATLEPACQDEEMPLHADAMTWSPDSSKVAWSLDATRLGYESDIYVYDRTSGEMTNLTDDGIVGGLMSSDVTDTGSVPLDLFPTWSGDSQTLTFARSAIGPDAIPGTSLMTIDAAGGEPELLAVVYQERLAIWTPMVRTADGALLYSVLPIDMGRKESGIWQLADGGDPEMLLEGSEHADYPMPAIMDTIEVDGSVRITGYSTVNASNAMMEGAYSFVMDLASGETTPITLPGDESVALGAAGFSPDGTALAAINLGEGEPALEIIGNDGQAQEIPLGEPVDAAVGSGTLLRAPEWAANNTILVTGGLPGQYLVTLPASGSATPDDTSTAATPCSCTPPPEQD